MKLVEVRFDLENSNEKVIFDYYEIINETEKYYFCEIYEKTYKKFLKGTLNTALYGGKLNYYYRFVTNDSDYKIIETSKEMNKAVTQVFDKLNHKLDYYKKTLKNRLEYFLNMYNE